MPGEKLVAGQCREACLLGQEMSSQRQHAGRRRRWLAGLGGRRLALVADHAIEDVALENGRDHPPVFGVEGGIEGMATGEKGLRRPFDVLADGKIADALLADVAVDIGEHDIEDILGEDFAGFTLGAQSADDQCCMHADQLEPAIRRVRNTPFGIKHRLAGPSDDHVIDGKSSGKPRPVGLATVQPATELTEKPATYRPKGLFRISRHRTSSFGWRKVLLADETRPRASGSCATQEVVMTGVKSRVAVLFLAAGLVGGLAACSPQVIQHGHTIDPESLARITPGVTSREEVARLMGSPSALATFEDDRWYYVTQRRENHSFFQSDITEQEVVTITFDARGIVSELDQHGMDQAMAIEPDPDSTQTLGNEMTVVEQLIGNVGRFGDPAAIPPGQRP